MSLQFSLRFRNFPEFPNIMIPLNYILNTWAMGRTQDILGSYGLNAWQAVSLPNYALRF